MSNVIWKYGDYYGYPDCCIKAFEDYFYQRIEFEQLSLVRQKTSLKGFIPCETCAKKILSKELNIAKLINAKRKHHKSFIYVDDE
jgi:hypothetical protein